MKYAFMLLAAVCAVQFCYIRKVHSQAAAWLRWLKEIKDEPQKKLFIKGRGLFSEIHFELNGILDENQKNLLELKKAEDANRRFLTDLSHDVRTPLASLTGYLEALLRGETDNQEEYIHISYQKALALKSLIDMLFEWCKLYSGSRTYQMERCDMNELTRECVIGWLPLLEKKGIMISVNTSDEEWEVSADRTAYKRVLDNLIQNAVEHGNCSRICIGVQKKREAVSVTVFNDGGGIPEEKLPYLFDRLYKGDPARTEAGSGLGLTIAKELTAGMSGEMKVKNTAGEGVAFSVVFPQYVRES